MRRATISSPATSPTTPTAHLSGGTITGWTRITNGGTEFTLSGLNYPVALFLADLATGDNAGLLNSVLGNNDKISGSTAGDVLSGYDGKDTMDGAGGNDVLFGLQGDDSLVGGIGNDILQGGDGNDTLAGGIGDDRYFDCRSQRHGFGKGRTGYRRSPH